MVCSRNMSNTGLCLIALTAACIQLLVSLTHQHLYNKWLNWSTENDIFNFLTMLIYDFYLRTEMLHIIVLHTTLVSEVIYVVRQWESFQFSHNVICRYLCFCSDFCFLFFLEMVLQPWRRICCRSEAHCLESSDYTGGILVLGELMELGLVILLMPFFRWKL
jgi:hypothetical protein